MAVAGETLIVGSRWESGDRNGIENTEAVATGAIYVFDLPAKTIGGIRSISTDGDVRCLTIPPAFGRDIGVEYSSDLSPGSWIELGNFFFEVNSEGIFIDPDPTRTSRPTGYYRAFLRPVVSP